MMKSLWKSQKGSDSFWVGVFIHTERVTHPNSIGTEAPTLETFPRPCPMDLFIWLLSESFIISFNILVNISISLSSGSCWSKLTEPEEGACQLPIRSQIWQKLWVSEDLPLVTGVWSGMEQSCGTKPLTSRIWHYPQVNSAGLRKIVEHPAGVRENCFGGEGEPWHMWFSPTQEKRHTGGKMNFSNMNGTY